MGEEVARGKRKKGCRKGEIIQREKLERGEERVNDVCRHGK